MKKSEEEKTEKEQHKKQIKYMKAAMMQAKKAYQLGEVPIGCVVVCALVEAVGVNTCG